MSDTALPLSGIRVVDLGVGMAAALAGKLLVDAGAEVLRFEPSGGDPFYDTYPAYRFWQRGKTIATADTTVIATALDRADLCLLGGEAHPDLDWSNDASALRAGRERLIVLDISASPAGWAGDAFPAVELFAQARSGLVFEHFGDRPIMFAFAMGSIGAAMHGVAGLLAALIARKDTGRGEVVRTSLLQGALRWCSTAWLPAATPGPEFLSIIPKDVVPLRFQCADDIHVHVTPGVPGSYAKLYAVLGIHDPTLDPNARGSPTGGVHPSKYFGDVAMMQTFAGTWRSRDLLEALWAKQLPAEQVMLPGQCWDDAQTKHNGVIARDADGWEYVGRTIRYGEPAAIAPPPPQPAPPTRAPLAGMRIVDLGSFAAGPHASVILGDLGADVIKIERPEGDPMRPGIYHFAASSRGKRSIAIDLKLPEATEIVRRICARADIVHHNFRPGVSARLGVDAATLKQVNPGVVVLESLAYGPDGPKAMQSGFDPSFQAICGFESFPGNPRNPPLYYRFALCDYGTATVGAVAMLLAQFQKQRGQVSNEVFTSLLNAGIFMKSEVVRRPDGTLTGAPQYDIEHRGHHPAESIYRTADGWIAIAARGAAMARRLGEALGITPALEAPLAQWGEAESQALAQAFADRSSADNLALLEAANVWAVNCDRTIDDLMTDPALRALGLVYESDDPRFGHVQQVGRAVNFESAQLPVAGRGLLDSIGGHTREILAECGYAAPEIDDLFARKVVA